MKYGNCHDAVDAAQRQAPAVVYWRPEYSKWTVQAATSIPPASATAEVLVIQYGTYPLGLTDAGVEIARTWFGRIVAAAGEKA